MHINIDNPETFQKILSEMDYGFALHEIICDENGKPIDYRYLAVNKAFERLTLLNSSTIIGKRVKEVLPDVAERFIHIYGKVAITGNSVTFDDYVQSMDKYFHIYAFSPQKGQFACFFSNITAEMKLKKEVEAGYKNFMSVFDNAPNIMYLVDRERRIFKMNHLGLDTIEKNDEEVFGIRGGNLFSCVHSFKDSRGCGFSDQCHKCVIKQTIEEVINTNERVMNRPGVLTLLDKEKKQNIMKILISASPIQAFEKDLVQISIVDITEVTALRDQLLINANLATLGQLSAAIVHEINNPLGIIRGHADLLKMRLTKAKILTPEYDSYFENITIGFERIKGIVQGLKKSARYEEDDLNEKTDLCEVIEDTMKLVGYIYKRESIEVKYDFQVKTLALPTTYVKLQQVIFNILSNSKDAIMEKGNSGGEITLSISESSEKHLFSCRDNGIGMNVEQSKRLFQQSFTTKQGGKGSGIGTTIIKAIMKELNGEIKVQSHKNEGTTVTFLFPKS